MSLTLVVVGLGVACLVAFLLSPAGPEVVRAKPLGFVGQRAPRLAISRAGSRLEIEHDGTSRSFRLVKAQDDGTLEQALVLSFPEEGWLREAFEDAVEKLKGADFASDVRVTGVTPDRILEAKLVGRPPAMEFYSVALAQLLSSALQLEQEEPFTFRLWSVTDGAVWRRLNADGFRQMATPQQPWLIRWFGQRQLKRYEDERRGNDRSA